MEFKEILEEFSGTTNEEELVDDFEDIQIEPDDVQTDDEIENTTHTSTEKLEALAKISRGLDILADALDEFETSIIDVIDITEDSTIINATDDLRRCFDNLRQLVSPEKPTEPKQDFSFDLEDENKQDEPEQEQEIDIPVEDDEDVPEINFDKEAALFNFDDGVQK